ncbi:MAG TPA: TonB-dependent receptor [Saprospiraceae bacterium]|nr:TonB-dependent receptor [Saprospiraceae bacterium]
MNQRYIPLLLLFCISLYTKAQSNKPFEIQGQVKDLKTGVNLEYVNLVFNSLSAKKVEGTVTDIDGKYKIILPKSDYYKVTIQFIAYKSLTYDSLFIDPSIAQSIFKNIKLEPDQKVLDEVVISDEKQIVQQAIDKKVINVAKDAINTGSDALSVVDRLPGVDVDADGNISYRGMDNMKILIDGRPIGKAEKDLLRQMQSSQIDKIEFISNPSAKYNPEGMSGLINIILKKNNSLGWSGTASTIFTQGFRPKYTAGLSLGMRNKFWSPSLDYNYNYNHGYVYGTNFREFTENSYNSISQSSFNTSLSKIHNLKLASDFFINSGNTIYTIFNATIRNQNAKPNLTSTYRDSSESVYNETKRIGNNTGKNSLLEFVTGYQYRSKNQKNSLDYEVSFKQVPSENTNLYSDYLFANLTTNNQELIDDLNKIFNTRLDYTRQITKAFQLEAGTQIGIQSIENSYSFYTKNSSESNYSLDTTASNIFHYNETVYAAYLSSQYKYKTWTFKAGLRPEISRIESKLLTTNQTYPQNYFNLFPSAYLLYSPSAKHSFGLSFSQRINRPTLEQLNPFNNRVDPTFNRIGNPFLKPEYAYISEINYQYRTDKLTISPVVYYRRLYNQILREIQFDATTGNLLVITKNYRGNHFYGLEINTNYQYSKKLKFNHNISYNEGNLLSEPTNFNVNRKSDNLTSSINISYNTHPAGTLQLSGKYRTIQEVPVGQFLPSSNVDIAYTLLLWKKKGTLTFKASDIFLRRLFRIQTLNQENFSSSTIRTNETRTFVLSFSYKFGSGSVQKSSKRKEEEKDRIERSDF